MILNAKTVQRTQNEMKKQYLNSFQVEFVVLESVFLSHCLKLPCWHRFLFLWFAYIVQPNPFQTATLELSYLPPHCTADSIP